MTQAYYSLFGAELRYEARLVPELSSQQTGEGESLRMRLVVTSSAVQMVGGI